MRKPVSAGQGSVDCIDETSYCELLELGQYIANVHGQDPSSSSMNAAEQLLVYIKRAA
jgi:hypothetical protein